MAPARIVTIMALAHAAVFDVSDLGSIAVFGIRKGERAN